MLQQKRIIDVPSARYTLNTVRISIPGDGVGLAYVVEGAAGCVRPTRREMREGLHLFWFGSLSPAT